MTMTELARVVENLAVPCEYTKICTTRATLLVHIHQIDRCNGRNLNHGDYLYTSCEACADIMAWRMGVIVGEMYGALPDSDHELVVNCKTCGRVILEMEDVMKTEEL